MLIPSSGPHRCWVGCALSATVGEPTSMVLAIAVYARADGALLEDPEALVALG
jgi:hypothetical protein